VLFTAGAIDKAVTHPAAPHPVVTPTPTATPAVWLRPNPWTELLTDARTELEATTTAIRASHLDGQSLQIHQKHCGAAVALYNWAALHLLDTPPIDSTQECKP
jgi:hypothetical protein